MTNGTPKPDSPDSAFTQKTHAVFGGDSGWFLLLRQPRGDQKREQSLIVDPPVPSGHANGGESTDLRSRPTIAQLIARREPPERIDDQNSYTAALVTTAIIVPLLASIFALVLYSSRESIVRFVAPPPSALPPILIVLYATLAAVVVWLLYGWWYKHFTTPMRANAGAYGELRDKLGSVNARIIACEEPTHGDETYAAYAEASLFIEAAKNELVKTKGALRWTNASGYIGVWTDLHRAEEALLLFGDDDAAVAAGRYDELRLTGSHLESRDELLQLLRQALASLGEPLPPGIIVRQPPLATKRARMMLVTVRRSINEYRDSLREGLVRARNRLKATTLSTALFIYGVVITSLLLLNPGGPTTAQSIYSTIALFLTGAMIGLFNRMYLDFSSSTGVEDYSLTTSRLVATPLLSGIAAVCGVLLSVLVPALLINTLPNAQNALSTPTALVGSPTANLPPTPRATSGATTPADPTPSLPGETAPLSRVFDVAQYPLEFVLAAVFGLTPGLLISRLQKQTEQVKDDLASTQATQQSVLRRE